MNSSMRGLTVTRRLILAPASEVPQGSVGNEQLSPTLKKLRVCDTMRESDR